MTQLLVVVDFQNDFVTGVLGFPEAAHLAKPIASKIAAYRSGGEEVVFTYDTHSSDYLSTQEGKYLPLIHCEKDTFGHALYGAVGLAAQARDKRFYKSAFGSSEFFEWLQLRQNSFKSEQNKAFERIELVGLVSHICVLTQAVLAKTAAPEAVVCVDASCVASFDKHLHQAALDVMEGLQIEVINR